MQIWYKWTGSTVRYDNSQLVQLELSAETSWSDWTFQWLSLSTILKLLNCPGNILIVYFPMGGVKETVHWCYEKNSSLLVPGELITPSEGQKAWNVTYHRVWVPCKWFWVLYYTTEYCINNIQQILKGLSISQDCAP